MFSAPDLVSANSTYVATVTGDTRPPRDPQPGNHSQPGPDIGFLWRHAALESRVRHGGISDRLSTLRFRRACAVQTGPRAGHALSASARNPAPGGHHRRSHGQGAVHHLRDILRLPGHVCVARSVFLRRLLPLSGERTRCGCRRPSAGGSSGQDRRRSRLHEFRGSIQRTREERSGAPVRRGARRLQ